MSEADGYSGELRDIAYHVECLVAAVERIEKALVPHCTERERIALQFVLHRDEDPQAAFRIADWFLQERDKQRAQAQQGGQTSEQA